MTINIKRRSGGIVELVKLFHESLADQYRARYAAVPVKVRKHRMSPEMIGLLREKQRADARAVLRAEMLRDMARD